MSSWGSVAKALLAVESLERKWARELRLDGREVFVLLSLTRAPLSCATIAMECGRQRQHVQRTLRGLEQRAFVTPVRADDDRVHAWRLSAAGAELARRLQMRSDAWERMVSPVIDLREFEEQLNRLTQVLVNQPLNNGWAHALSEAFETRELFWDIPASKRAWRSTDVQVAEPEEASRPRGELHEAVEAEGGSAQVAVGYVREVSSEEWSTL